MSCTERLLPYAFLTDLSIVYGNFGGATVNSAWNYNYEVLPFNNPVSKRLNNPTSTFHTLQ